MTFCPSCGFNLTRDEIVERDGWTLDPRGQAFHRGSPVQLRRAQAFLLHTIGSTSRLVGYGPLIERCCGDIGGIEVLRAHVSQAKRKLREQGLPVPWRNSPGLGYEWDERAVASA